MEDSFEYQRLHTVLCQIKHFVKNKLADLLNIDEPYGKPNSANQEIIKESYLLEDLVELVGYIWPDEHHMKNEFSEELVDESESSLMQDPHRQIKAGIAEKVFELLTVCCWENIPI